MSPREDEATRFLNVDLDLESPDDLTPLLEALAPDLFVLHCEHGHEHEHDQPPASHRPRSTACLELSTEAPTPTPDDAIRRIVQAVTRLPPAPRRHWDHATTRALNIGVQAGHTPHQFAFALPPATLAAASSIGATIVVTVYSPTPP